MSDAIRAASRVRSIQDIPYQLPADTCYHPTLNLAALKRIREKVLADTADERFKNQREQTRFLYILAHVFATPAVASVWSVVFERKNDCFFVLRNLAHTGTSPRYRRVLHVSLDALAELEVPSPYSCIPAAAEAHVGDSEVAMTADVATVREPDAKNDLPWWLLYVVLTGLLLGASHTFYDILLRGIRKAPQRVHE